MPDMPEGVSKGPILSDLGRLLSKSSHSTLVYGWLSAGQTVPQAMRNIAANPSMAAVYRHLIGAAITHVENDWFQNWWTSSQPIEPIVNRGIRTAIEAADKKHGLPVDCYWVCHTGHGYPHEAAAAPQVSGHEVEASVCWSAFQVTLTFHTPPPPTTTPPSLLTVDEPILIVKRDPANPSNVIVVQPKAQAFVP